MSPKSSLIWLLLLVLLAVVKVSAASVSEGEEIENDEDNESTQLDDNHVEEEEHAQRESYSFNYDASQPIQDPDLIYANIIGGGFEDELPPGLLLELPPDYIFSVLTNPVGARLAASRPLEVFTTANAYALAVAVNEVHAEFFNNFQLFSLDKGLHGLSNIPFSFIIRTIRLLSNDFKMNLNKFIDAFENYDENLSFEIDKSLCLPHLFNLHEMVNPEYYLGRGLSYDSGADTANQIMWDISMQLFVHQLLNNENFNKSEKYEEILQIVSQEILSSRLELYADESSTTTFTFNYFGLENTSDFHLDTIFNGQALESMSERSFDIEQLAELCGFDEFLVTEYDILIVEERIIYRLLVYVMIFNPSSCDPEVRNNFITAMISDVPSTDFTDAEMEFFVSQCLRHGLGDLIVMILRSENQDMKNMFISKITSDPRSYDMFLSSISKELDKVGFMKRWRDPLHTCIKLENEEYYLARQLRREPVVTDSSSSSANDMEINFSDSHNHAAIEVEDEEFIPLPGVKRRRNGERVPESHVSSHFLSTEQLRSFDPLFIAERGTKTFVVPYPDKIHFTARLDNLMQKMDSPDFGVMEWQFYLNSLEPAVKAAYIEHEKILDEFVRLVYQAVDYMRCRPQVTVKIVFRGSPGHGDGPKFEALELFARAILLPQFKVFYYNTAIGGFIPYPLLDEKIMSNLGYLNAWFVKHSLPLSWNLAEAYRQFFFYEEDPFLPMQTVVDALYGRIFRNLDGLISPHTNPLEFFPTTFYSHRPLAGFDLDIDQVMPLDLFSPTDSSNDPNFNSLFTFLDSEKIDLLTGSPPEPSNMLRISIFTETKEEDQLIESKVDDEDAMNMERNESISTFVDPVEDFYRRQEALKASIVETMKYVASQEITERLLMGRFAFMRYFLDCFNTFAQAHVTSDFYGHLELAQAAEITIDSLLPGLEFNNPRTDIEVRDEHGQTYTPRQALEEILRALPQEMLRTFYWFCTGCFSLPFSGLESNPIAVQISTEQGLPASRTCFRTLTLKLHPSKNLNELVRDMLRALNESSGFHVEEGRNNNGEVVGVFTDVPIVIQGDDQEQVQGDDQEQVDR